MLRTWCIALTELRNESHVCLVLGVHDSAAKRVKRARRESLLCMLDMLKQTSMRKHIGKGMTS